MKSLSFVKTPLRQIFAVCLLAISLISIANAADWTDADKAFLASYEQVRAALAKDDLAGAKAAAATLKGDDADKQKLAAAGTIEIARGAFEGLSGKAIKLAKGAPGYYVINCPMAQKDWVQTSDKVSNPYMGRAMLTCGVVKK